MPVLLAEEHIRQRFGLPDRKAGGCQPWYLAQTGRADSTPRVEPFQVAETEQTRASLPIESEEEAKLWFYRVTAEDLAGNEAGRPD